MGRNIIATYQAVIKPTVDSEAWEKATKTIQSKLGAFTAAAKKRDALNEYVKTAQANLASAKSEDERKRYDIDLQDANKMLQEFNAAGGQTTAKFGDLINGFSKGTAAIGAFVKSVEVAYQAFTEIADAAIEFSNKNISGSSIKVDTETRGYMAKFGVSSTEAQAMSAALETTGYSLEDIAVWTDAQKEHYAELMQVYQDGLNSLDPGKLEKFNTATQDYQATMDSFMLKLDLGLNKILASSSPLPDLLDTVGHSMETITEILNSPLIQFGFDVIVGVLDAIAHIADFLLSGVNFLLGGGSTSTTTNNNQTSTVNQTNNFINPDMTAIANQLSYGINQPTE